MLIQVNWISGISIGLEFLWDINGLVIDLGIIRVYFIKGELPNDG